MCIRKLVLVTPCFDHYNFIGNETNYNTTDIDYYAVYSNSTSNFDVVPKGSNLYILKIPIVDDRILESNELFRIYVVKPTLPDNEVTVFADVIIRDDDRKCYCLLYYIS